MAERVTTKRITAQQNRVNDQHQCAYSNPETFTTLGIGKPHRLPGIPSQNKNKNHREVHEVAMHILKNQWKSIFTPIGFAGFTHGARNRVGPERAIVRAAVVITGGTKSTGCPEN